MSFFCTIWEYLSNLSPAIKRTLFFVVVGAVLGMPTSEYGWIWKWARQSVQMQNCGDDAVRSILDSMESDEPHALERAVSPDSMQDLKTCARDTIQHPKGSIPFLLDEHRRLSTNATPG